MHPTELLDDPARMSSWEEQVAQLDDLVGLSGNPVQILDLAEAGLGSATPHEAETLAVIAADEVSLTGSRLTVLLRRAGVDR